MWRGEGSSVGKVGWWEGGWCVMWRGEGVRTSICLLFGYPTTQMSMDVDSVVLLSLHIMQCYVHIKCPWPHYIVCT